MEIIYFLLFACVLYMVYYVSKNTSKDLTNKNKVKFQIYQVANSMRIILESSKIVSETKNYDTKLGRATLIRDTLVRLNSLDTSYLVKDDNWSEVLSAYYAYNTALQDIESKRRQILDTIINSRGANTCPYCLKNTFAESSRAVKCTECKEKAHRYKVSKGFSYLVTNTEHESLIALESEILACQPNSSVPEITVLPQVLVELEEMAAKLRWMNA